MAIDVHLTHPHCNMCNLFPMDRACLEHTCPDCGHIVWNERNGRGELIHECPTDECPKCSYPEPHATGRDNPANDTYEVHCDRCEATFMVPYRPGPTVLESADQLRRWAQRTGPCPCECNSGGFCGGCGHAGCGRR